MSKTRGYLMVRDRYKDVIPVYVENPKREYIEAGDEVLIREYDGDVSTAVACCQIQTSYSDEKVDELLGKIGEVFNTKTDRMPRLIGIVMRDYWYGDAEDEQDAE